MINILLDIQERLPNLTEVESRIANAILTEPKAILSMSAQKLAECSQTSPAAISRFSRRMGLSGFPDLKIHLSAILTDDPKAQLLREVEADASISEIKDNIQQRMARMGQKTAELLVDEQVERAEQLIDQLTIGYVYGIGASQLVAQDICQKFTRVGKTILTQGDLHLLVTQLLAQKSSKYLILISNSGETLELIQLAKLAKQHAIPVIAITGYADSTLASLSDILLIIATGEGFRFRTAATISLMAQLYVVDVLFYTHISKHYAVSEALLKLSKEAIEGFW